MSSLYSLVGDRDRPHFEPRFISFAFHSACYKDSPFSLPFLFFPPLTAVSAFHTWQMIARVKVFSVSILHFPKGEQKRGTSFLQLVSLRKLFRIASFQGRLANAYNPRLSAIVHHNLAIILCLFHLENPYPIKVIQPFQYLLPIKSGRYYLP